jgi:hypothetical protein
VLLLLHQAAHGYKVFNEKQDGCVKVVLKTPAGRAQDEAPQGVASTAGVGQSAGDRLADQLSQATV